MEITQTEYLLIISTLSLGAVVALSYKIYCFYIYKNRQLAYGLFAARDAMIRSVAVGAIDKDSNLFKFFYSNVNSLINAIHSDFFSMQSFIVRITELEKNNHLKVKVNNVMNDLKKSEPQFQQAVGMMVIASQKIMIEKSLVLRFLVNTKAITYPIIKWLSKHVSEKKTNSIRTRAHFDEYRQLDKFKANINLTNQFA